MSLVLYYLFTPLIFSLSPIFLTTQEAIYLVFFPIIFFYTITLINTGLEDSGFKGNLVNFQKDHSMQKIVFATNKNSKYIFLLVFNSQTINFFFSFDIFSCWSYNDLRTLLWDPFHLALSRN